MTTGTKGIVSYKGKILLILRDNKPTIPYPNTWDCMGGGQENGESYEETGLRETEEEIGVRPHDYRYMGKVTLDDGRVAGRFIAFLNDEEYKRVKLGDEGQKMEWFTLSEAIKLEMPPTIKKYLVDNYETFKTMIEEH